MELYKYTFHLITDLDGNFESTELSLLKYRVLKETKSGYWIAYYGKNRKKWVPKNGKNLFAFDTEYKALDNFIHRKKRQIGLIRFNLRRIKEALGIAENLIEKIKI